MIVDASYKHLLFITQPWICRLVYHEGLHMDQWLIVLLRQENNFDNESDTSGMFGTDAEKALALTQRWISCNVICIVVLPSSMFRQVYSFLVSHVFNFENVLFSVSRNEHVCLLFIQILLRDYRLIPSGHGFSNYWNSFWSIKIRKMLPLSGNLSYVNVCVIIL